MAGQGKVAPPTGSKSLQPKPGKSAKSVRGKGSPGAMATPPERSRSMLRSQVAPDAIDDGVATDEEVVDEGAHGEDEKYSVGDTSLAFERLTGQKRGASVAGQIAGPDIIRQLNEMRQALLEKDELIAVMQQVGL